MSLIGTRVIDNTATAEGGTARGGGIHVGRTGELTLTSSTVWGNDARAAGGTARGGGISNATGGSVTTDQSYISKNAAEAPEGGTAEGGGLFHAFGSTTPTKSTVTGHRAADGGGHLQRVRHGHAGRHQGPGQSTEQLRAAGRGSRVCGMSDQPQKNFCKKLWKISEGSSLASWSAKNQDAYSILSRTRQP
ncbi:hypothetical protein ACFZBM_34385 [Streptomyces lavendulae]|uniref:hypothetical protein n=1 Tax=Streptomyces lavendulae TaxID=1914 RepID=UPI0036E46805